MFVVVCDMPAEPKSRAGAHSSTATTFAIAFRIVLAAFAFALAATAAGARACRALLRQREAGGNRFEIKRMADEVAQRDDEVVRVHRAALDGKNGTEVIKAPELPRPLLFLPD